MAAGSPAKAAAFQLGPGVRVRLSVKNFLLCLFGKLFDTGLYPPDFRIVVGKLVAFKGASGRSANLTPCLLSAFDLIRRQQRTAVQACHACGNRR